jgi:hypothetical protein
MSKYLTLEEYMIIYNHTFVHFSLINYINPIRTIFSKFTKTKSIKYYKLIWLGIKQKLITY